MAQYICVERRAIHVVPDSIPLDVAALVEPLAVGWHAVKKSAVQPGDQCLVLGAGWLCNLLLNMYLTGPRSHRIGGALLFTRLWNHVCRGVRALGGESRASHGSGGTSCPKSHQG